MDAIDIRFHSNLVQLINKERNRQAQHLVDGRGVSDWADYKRLMGVLEGLAIARELARQLADADGVIDREMAKMMETNE